MGIRRLPSGSYQARLQVDGQPHAATFPTRDRAELWLAETRQRARTGQLPAPTTVEDWAERWARDFQGDDPAIQAIEQWVLPHIGHRRLDHIRPGTITRLLDQIRDTHGPAREAYTALHDLFDAAVFEQLIHHSPVDPRRHRPSDLHVRPTEPDARPPIPDVLDGHELTRQDLRTAGTSEIWLTTGQAARMLGISRTTLINLLDQGHIPHTRPGRHRRIRHADVLAYRSHLDD